MNITKIQFFKYLAPGFENFHFIIVSAINSINFFHKNCKELHAVVKK